MNKTDIEWTHLSANPIKYRRKSDGKVVWGCVKTSPGCAHCYSEAIALRFERGKVFNAANMDELEPFLDEKEVHEMLNRRTCGGVKVDGSRCFVGDMTDVFGEWVPDELLFRLFNTMGRRSSVTWQLLTKRAERMADFVNKWVYRDGRNPEWVGQADENVWLGVSAEDQQRADERIPWLLKCPAVVRFVSAEPLLSSIDCGDMTGLQWLIAGGESGHGARPCHIDWIRGIRDQCKAAGVACHIKQLGRHVHLDSPGGQRSSWLPNNSKGGDWAEWPEDLRVREFPEVQA